MELLGDQFEKTSNEVRQDSDNRRPQIYYQYELLEEIEKMNLDKVLSGFTVKGSTNIYISNRDQRRTGQMHVIRIDRITRGRHVSA